MEAVEVGGLGREALVDVGVVATIVQTASALEARGQIQLSFKLRRQKKHNPNIKVCFIPKICMLTV